MISKALKIFSMTAFVALVISLYGCTARTITITTNPPGGEVSINHRVIGNAPIRVGFTHYGTYRIEIRMEKYETLVREEEIKPPTYGYDPITLVTDNAIPARLNDDIYLHYVLKKHEEVDDRTALLARATQARDGIITKKDGGQIHVAYSVPPKTPEQLAKDAKNAAKAVPSTGTATTEKPAVPGDDFKVKPITVEEPEGPKISKDLNIKTPEVPKVPEVKTPPKDQVPARTPKSEELIFEKPKVAPKADEKK